MYKMNEDWYLALSPLVIPRKSKSPAPAVSVFCLFWCFGVLGSWGVGVLVRWCAVVVLWLFCGEQTESQHANGDESSI